ncbi:MAG: hypothetical protein ABI675_12700 [Chitinophagaceae bacterium]
MSGKVKISEYVLSEMNNFLDNEKYVGQIAMSADMLFITDGSWLKDAAVIDSIINRQGAWDVYLIFAHYKNPLQLIVRNITRCFSEQKAMAAAFYIRKEAAKDRRGTLTVSIEDLGLCSN